MQALNLPSYNYKLKKIDGKTYIFDFIRKKYLVLTPEEWVRQHFINMLVTHLNYPKGRLGVEKGMNYQKNISKRTDILIYDKEGKVDILIELKAPSVKLSKAVLLQLATYNKIHNARLLLISNGIEVYCFQVNEGKVCFLEELPHYTEN